MSSTVNVLTGLGEGPFAYREMGIGESSLGILTGPRTKPRILSAGLRGYYLGLHDEGWSNQSILVLTAGNYYVRIVPICANLSDPNGAYLEGTPTIVNNAKGVSFTFQPFPDGYFCTGYKVWAGTVLGTYYSQGTLNGRFNTSFTIGTTWSYTSTGTALSAQTIGPPAFASALEVYQLEGTTDSRLFMAGGKLYSDGYAKVAKASSAPILAGGTGAEDQVATWNAVTNGSFRMRQKWTNGRKDFDYYIDYTGLNFSSCAGMTDVGTALQTAIRAAQFPYLITGTPSTTIAEWSAITDGSFRVFVNGQSVDVTGCDFSACTTMANIATVIQTQMQLQTLLAAGTCDWDATALRFKLTTGQALGAELVTNGDFSEDDHWTKDAGWTISGNAAHADIGGSGNFAIKQAIPMVAGKKYRLRFTVSNFAGGAGNVCIATISSGAVVDPLVGNRGNGTFEFLITCSASGNKDLAFYANWIQDPHTTLDLDNVSVIEEDFDYVSLGYLERHSAATGTDISIKLMGREDSSGVYLFPCFKPANSDTVAWQGDHFDFTGATPTAYTGSDLTITSVSGTLDDARGASLAGISVTNVGQLLKVAGDEGNVYRIFEVKWAIVSAYEVVVTLRLATPFAGPDTTAVTYRTVYDGAKFQFSFVEPVLYSLGTDIGAMLDWLSTSATAVLTQGQTEYRSVIGQSTKWGDWCEGMRMKVAGESGTYIVQKCIGEGHIYLDSDYDGDALLGNQEYALLPYSQQVYPSELGNPFKFEAASIIPLPTSDSDEICTMATAGSVIAIMMDHHVWFIDGVDVTSPRMVDATHGCPFVNAAVPYKNMAAAFTGKDFIMVSGTGVQIIDPDKRVRHLIKRLNLNADIQAFGVYLNDQDTDIIMWWLPIDDSYKPNIALCFEPSTANWWVYNHKAASCATILRDARKNVHLMTALPADTGLSIPAFTLLHSRDYHADAAAVGTGVDRQGLIGSVGASTATAGYLTCKASGLLTDFTPIADGYFTLDVDDGTYLVGPCDFTGAASLAAVAAIIQTAIRAATGGSETCTYDTDHFVITSGTLTNRSSVGYLRAGYDVYTDTDISGSGYMNGQEGVATKTYPVNTLVLNLTKLDGTASSVYADNDGEKSTYIFVCDSNYRNGAYAKISANTAGQVTITPIPSVAPVAGWRWYIGGIVPSWMKWFDFNSPHHKNKLGAVAITVPQTEGTSGNTLALHGMQDLVSTIRTTKTQALGVGQDPTNMLFLSDKPATQQGVKIIRPSADYDLEIDDITIIHTPIV